MIGFAALSFSPASLWAHGEDKPGPHGGVIRMPGAFHTEVKQVDENSLAVYLLDINFQGPTVRDSSVKVAIKAEETEKSLVCKANQTFFTCEVPKDATLLKGDLLLTAVRMGAKGIEMRYPFPLMAAH